jgi:hypothetical protein
MAEENDTITIQGHDFPVSPRFEEGHQLTEIEADVLNQTYYENLRNNFAGRIKAARKEHNVEEGQPLPEHVYQNLQGDFATYAKEYEFGVRRTSTGPGADPVRAAALTMARTAIKDALRQAKKLKETPTEAIEAAAERLIQSQPQFLEKARVAVEERKANADAALRALQGGGEAQQEAA